MNDKLKYSDERDKSYGIAGMAISLLVYDNPHLIARVDLDAEPLHSIVFTPEADFISSPRYSAKLAWSQLLRQYHLATGMLIANLMARNYVQHRRRLSDDIVQAIKQEMDSNGNDMCMLEHDEVDAIYRKNYAYFDDLFMRRTVHSVTNAIVDALIQQRTLGADDLDDLMSPLGH